MSAAKREDLLEASLSTLAGQLGYDRRIDLRHMGADRRWAFERDGAYFKTEAVCFLYRRRPKPRLMVDYLGSPLPPDKLVGKSLEGIAIAQNLFDYQFAFDRRDPKTILPSVLEIRNGEDIAVLLSGLEEEMIDVETRIWPTLAETWERATGTSPRGTPSWSAV